MMKIEIKKIKRQPYIIDWRVKLKRKLILTKGKKEVKRTKIKLKKKITP